jgi:hypothetical protein
MFLFFESIDDEYNDHRHVNKDNLKHKRGWNINEYLDTTQ